MKNWCKSGEKVVQAVQKPCKAMQMPCRSGAEVVQAVQKWCKSGQSGASYAKVVQK
jgi:hypothetical protein